MKAPDKLAKMERLTQEYGRFSQSRAGLGAVVGAIGFIWMAGLPFGFLVMEFLGVNDVWSQKGFLQWAIHPDFLALPWIIRVQFLLIPLVWWAIEQWLQGRIYEVNGRVSGVAPENMNLRVAQKISPFLTLFTGLALAGLKGLMLKRLGWPPVEVAWFLASLGLLVAWVAVTARLRCFLDFPVGTLLVMFALMQVSGTSGLALIGLSLLYLPMAFGLAGWGLWNHARFRRAVRELEAAEMDDVAEKPEGKES